MEFRRFLSSVIGLTLVMLFVVACDTLVPPTPTSTAKPEGIEIETVIVERTVIIDAPGTPPSQPTPSIIEHPQPTLALDAEVFRTSDSRVEYLCDWRIQISDMYGGLEPSYPIAVCQKEWPSGAQCLRESGGIIHICEQVIVYLDGTFQLIRTREELRDLFAPIESADEALSYALLATGYSVKYAPGDYRLAVPGSCDPGHRWYRYYVDTLEDTHVVEVESGYQVHLFDSQEFGCAPHPVWSVIVQVNHDGVVTEQSKKKLFEESSGGPGCCVD
jgi:hypothetical protein